MCNRFESLSKIKVCCQLIGKCLIQERTVLVTEVSGLLVQTHGIQSFSFNGCDLRSNQCCLTSKILGTVLRPMLKFLEFLSKSRKVLRLYCRLFTAKRCQRECVKKAVSRHI